MSEYLSNTMLRIRAGVLRLAAKALRHREGRVKVAISEIGLSYSVDGIYGIIPWMGVWRVEPELLGKTWMVDVKELVMAGVLVPEGTFACETLHGNRGEGVDKCCDPMPGEELEETLAWSKVPVIYAMFHETGIEFHWVDSSDVTILAFSIGGIVVEKPGKKS